MARADWLRTFLAVYRSGSVTAGAQHRGLTQPAASQHLAALEGSLGGSLFVRTPGGMEPTQQGRELYARVAEPLDGLETVLRDLDAGALRLPEPPVRLGSSPEFFSAVVLGRLVGLDVAVTATFGQRRGPVLRSRAGGPRHRGEQLDATSTQHRRHDGGPQSLRPGGGVRCRPLVALVLAGAGGDVAPGSVVGLLQPGAAPYPSVLAVGSRAAVLGSPAPRRPRPARRAQGRGARPRCQPAPRVRVCGIPGARTRRGALPGVPPDLRRAAVRLHPIGPDGPKRRPHPARGAARRRR